MNIGECPECGEPTYVRVVARSTIPGPCRPIVARVRRRFTAWLCRPYPEPRHRRHHRRPPNRPETHPTNSPRSYHS